MKVYDKLYPWQKNIVDNFSNKESFGIWLDMGLGKTPIGISLAEKNNCDKILIITINSKAIEDENVKGSWLWWLNQGEKHFDFKNKKDTEFNSNENECLILNYEALYERGKNRNPKEKVTLKSFILDFIKSCKNKKVAILIDESHKMKDLQSLQTSAIFKIKTLLDKISEKTFVYLLTGTPFTTGYEDLYSQLKMLNCNMNKTEFVDKFCERGNIKGLLGWQQPIVGYKNLKELYEMVHKYAITIKSEEVENLPEKIFVNYELPSSSKFELFIREKIKFKEVNEELKSRNLPYQISEKEWKKFSLEEKSKYLKLFGIEEIIEDGEKIYVCLNNYVGNPDSTIRQIYDELNWLIENTQYEELEKFSKFNWFSKTYIDILLNTDLDKKINNPFFRNIDFPNTDYLAETSGAFWLRCRQLSIGFNGNAEKAIWYDKSRLNQLEKFLSEHEDNYLLFYNFTPELLEIYDICERLGYKIDVYCGEIKSMKFYNDYANSSEESKLTNKKNIILANYSSGSTGMNWQEYHQCILFSCPLFSDYDQGIKRINRLGQKLDCIYHVFYQNNFLDMNMRKSLEESIEYSEDMFKSDFLRIQEILNN